MSSEPTTRVSLLIRLRDLRDGDAWSQFVELYLPLVFAYLRRRGLQDADAADVAQEVLQSVANAIPGFVYDPSRGSFRGWLLTVARSRAASWSKSNRCTTNLGNSIAECIDAQAVEQERAAWEEDFRQNLLRLAMEKVRPTVQPTTWQAFWRTSVDQRAAEEVAAELELSVGALYVARSRIIAKLRSAVRELEQQD